MATIERLRDKALVRVLHPRGQPTAKAETLSLAPRLDSLEGKTVYLIDVGFGGGYEFLAAMKSWLSTTFPTVKPVLKRKAGNMLLDNPELWAEIKAQGHAVIFGVGG
ncbi:MAG: hypothetical protein JO356_00080 [Acidobacteria bacterium]|nr:hypothetical protein [Acidobacteriota bacterium]